jgi:hypothetical protein
MPLYTTGQNLLQVSYVSDTDDKVSTSVQSRMEVQPELLFNLLKSIFTNISLFNHLSK